MILGPSSFSMPVTSAVALVLHDPENSPGQPTIVFVVLSIVRRGGRTGPRFIVQPGRLYRARTDE